MRDNHLGLLFILRDDRMLTHSFRVRVASSAKEAGIADSHIMILDFVTYRIPSKLMYMVKWSYVCLCNAHVSLILISTGSAPLYLVFAVYTALYIISLVLSQHLPQVSL